MQKSLEKIIEEKIKLITYIVDILDDAAYAERFISKPHNKNCPSMYRILDYCYDKKDLGFYDKPKLVLRATPRQMTNYGLAIDLLLMVDQVSEDPLLDRKILWLRAKRNSFVRIGKYLVYHRTTIKRMYDKILDSLTNKIIKESLDIYDRKFI